MSRIRALIAIVTVSCATVAAVVASPGTASAGTVPPSACDTSWKAPVAGSFWSAANWTHGGPGGQHACLPDFGTIYTVSVTGPGGQVASLSIGHAATLDVQAAPSGGARLVATSGITNDGTITLNQHAPTTGVDLLTAGTGGLVNDGLVEVEQSTVDIDAIDNTSGYLDVMQGTTLDLGALTNLTASALHGGTYFIDGTLQVPGAFMKSLDHAELDLDGAFVDENGRAALSGLSFDVATGSTLSVSGAAATGKLTNEGTVKLFGRGTVTAQQYVQGAGGATALEGGTLASNATIAANSTLEGAGVVGGNLTSAGTVLTQPFVLHPGTVIPLTVTGTYTAQRTATTAIEMDANAQFAPFTVSGTVGLGGTFAVENTAPTTPTGTVLTAMTCGPCVGAFTSVLATGYQMLGDGNTIALVALPRFESDAPGVALGGWQAVPDGPGYDGNYEASSTAGDSVAYSFTGSTVELIMRVGPTQGRARVAIDGKFVTTVDQFNRNAAFVSRTFEVKPSGPHTITVTVTGAHAGASSGSEVDVNGFDTPNGPGLDTTAAFDGWHQVADAAASDLAVDVASTKGAHASLAFTGSSVTWFARTGPTGGRARVLIDGVNRGTVDLYATTQHEQVPETIAGLAAGAHTVSIVALGTADKASSGTDVALDALVVNG